MLDHSDPATFRRQATIVYYWVLVGLAAFALGCAGLGWLLGRTWGLVIGVVVGLFLAGLGLVAVTLIYAMTQDSA